MRSNPAILDKLQDNAQAILDSLIDAFFDKVNSIFANLANATRNSSEQNVYLDAMSEVHLQRQHITQDFFTCLENDFAALALPTPATINTSPAEPTFPGSEKDRVEIEVAANNMINQARADSPTLLRQINTRLAECLRPRNVDENSNPLDPQQIVRHFVASSHRLQVPIQSRLIFFKQFERSVLRHYEQVLQDAHQVLLIANILPKLRPIENQTPLHSPNLAKPKVNAENNSAVTEHPLPPQGCIITAMRKAELDQSVIDTLLDEVNNFQLGAWFSFAGANTKSSIKRRTKRNHYKLTTKISATDTYIFVNRYRTKTQQITRDELAIALYDKTISPLNSAPIINRVLTRIATRLKPSLP
ncbi:MAG: hypothetical protein COA99_19920 [Moraxellaceae bacterium]|nr:MAG: hypothetical protein COA99_19920 [Moraxellaceae bacterium]